MVEDFQSKSRLVYEDTESQSSSSSTSDDSEHRPRNRRRRRRRRSLQYGGVDAYSPSYDEIRQTQSRRHSLHSSSAVESKPRVVEDGRRRHTANSETIRRVQSVRSSASSSQYKSPRDIVVEVVEDGQKEQGSRRRRSSSMREPQSRPGLSRSSTSARQTRTTNPLPTVQEESRLNVHRPPQRSYSVWGSLFGPQRRAEPEEQVSCLTCMDDVDASKAPELPCGHHMCIACLKRIFTLSATDPAHMPPKCCTEDVIPLKHVTKIFDDRFKMRWNRKYQEYTTKNRIYCSKKGCGSWIRPGEITRDKEGRKYGTCRRCKTQVCALCNGKRHKSKECPKDDETRDFAEMAKKNGWQQCYNCSATVELKEGCNHMTCRCTAQFCMICGLKWKTCNCPWFNYTAVNSDRLNHMNVPQVREEVARGGGAFAQPQAYQEEIEQRRRQEQEDEELARRVQATDFAFRGVAAFATWGFGRVAPDLNAGQAPRAMNFEDGRPMRHIYVADAGNPFNVQPIHIPPPIPMTAPQATTATAQASGASAQSTPSRVQAKDTRPTSRRGTAIRSNSRQEPKVKRTTTRSTDATASASLDIDADDEQASRAERRRSALLAGLNRGTNEGRVDAWRRQVTGEPVESPLFW